MTDIQLIDTQANSPGSSPRKFSIEPPPTVVKNTSNSGTSLFVAGLSLHLKEPEIQQHFEQYGHVSKVQIMCDPHTKESRGFGFVLFESEVFANTAMESLNGSEFAGKKLKIELAKRGRARTPTPGQYFDDSDRRDDRRDDRRGYERRDDYRDDRRSMERRDDRRSMDRNDGQSGRNTYIANNNGNRNDDRRVQYNQSPPRQFNGGRRSASPPRFSDRRERSPPRYNDRSPPRYNSNNNNNSNNDGFERRAPSPPRYNDRRERSPPRYNDRSPPRQEERRGFQEERRGYQNTGPTGQRGARQDRN